MHPEDDKRLNPNVVDFETEYEQAKRKIVMRVRVHHYNCIGDQNCVEICPEVFEMDEDEEVAVVKVEEVPEVLEEFCRRAAKTCPADAIVIEEEV